jgi:hypothetical protein
MRGCGEVMFFDLFWVLGDGIFRILQSGGVGCILRCSESACV